jgi:O-acetyl-ADP-ribose deacetylase (regulator of RNase III)
MEIELIDGDLLKQDVEVIVNAWNQNFIPWWLLIPQGVSKHIKKLAGNSPFKEIRKHGFLHLGEAKLTGAGTLPYKGIIHVAGINIFWFATRYSIEQSVRNAMKIVNEKQFKSIAFPLIGAGTGSKGKKLSEQIILDTLKSIDSHAIVKIVRFKK